MSNQLVTSFADVLLRERFGDLSDDMALERIDAIESIYAALGWLLKKKYYDGRKTDDEVDIDSTCINTYDSVAVLQSDTDGYYSVLPEMPMDLPKGLGVYSVRPLMNDARPFHPMSDGSVWLFSDLPQTFTTYSQRGNKVYYKNLNPNVVAQGVKLALVSARPTYLPTSYCKDIQDIVLGRWTKSSGGYDILNDGEPVTNQRN